MSSAFLPGRLSGTSSKTRLYSYTLAVLSNFITIFFYCAADSDSRLFLPSGSYLEHVFLNRIFIRDGFFYYENGNTKPTRLRFTPSEGITSPESCWSQGYDLKALYAYHLLCNTSQRRTPGNAAASLYSTMAPYGSYLDSCTGTMRTIENSRSYLYSSCMKSRAPRASSWAFMASKLDITDCNFKIILNENGRLKCQKHSAYSRKILSGSYLQHCNITDTYFFERTQQLTTVCPFGKVEKYISDACLGPGRDIIYQNGSLQCIESDTSHVEVHVASPYLPQGDYLLNCYKPAFYPCLGHNRKGKLVAECQTSRTNFMKGQLTGLVQASWNAGGSLCRVAQSGYITNRDGVLVCVPGDEFNDEDPTMGTDLRHTFQCND